MISTGIIIISGRPGYGKTYQAVKQVLFEVLVCKRLVYTNLPIRYKTLRAYLYIQARYKYGMSRDVARKISLFVKPIGFEHFNSFCQRLCKISHLFEDLKKACGSNSLTDDATFLDDSIFADARKQIADKDGPEIITGQGANWLPSGCCLFLDELHKWYPNALMAKQSEEILGYTTMHRHCKHKVFVLTQQAVNVAKAFRDNAVEYWSVVNLRCKKFLLFFRWPVLVFVWAKYSGDDVINGTLRPGAQALDKDCDWPYLSNYVIFRLYNSFTFDADSDDVKRQMESLQDVLKERPKMQMPRTIWDKILSFYMRIFKCVFLWPFRHWKLSGIIVLVLISAYKAGNGQFSKGVQIPEPTKIPAAKNSVVSASQFVPVINGITSKGVYINGKFIKIGESFQGASLHAVDLVKRVAIFDAGGNRFSLSINGGVQAAGVVERKNAFGATVRDLQFSTSRPAGEVSEK